MIDNNSLSVHYSPVCFKCATVPPSHQDKISQYLHEVHLRYIFTVLFCLTQRHTLTISGHRTRPRRGVCHCLTLYCIVIQLHVLFHMTTCSGPDETASYPLWLILTIVCKRSEDAGLQESCLFLWRRAVRALEGNKRVEFKS